MAQQQCDAILNAYRRGDFVDIDKFQTYATVGGALAIIQQRGAPLLYFVKCPEHPTQILTANVDGTYPVLLSLDRVPVGRWESWLKHPDCLCSRRCLATLQTSPIEMYNDQAPFFSFNVPCWSTAHVTLPALVGLKNTAQVAAMLMMRGDSKIYDRSSSSCVVNLPVSTPLEPNQLIVDLGTRGYDQIEKK